MYFLQTRESLQDASYLEVPRRACAAGFPGEDPINKEIYV